MKAHRPRRTQEVRHVGRSHECNAAQDLRGLHHHALDRGLHRAPRSQRPRKQPLAIAAVVDGSFSGGLYSGTLENGGVGLAPYNEFEDDVPDELKSEVEELQAQIISGELAVADYL